MRLSSNKPFTRRGSTKIGPLLIMKRYLIASLIPLLGVCAYPIKPVVINSVEDSRAMIAMARAKEDEPEDVADEDEDEAELE